MDYARLATSATRLLTKHGQSVTLRTVTESAHDLATESATTTTADETRYAVIVAFKQGDRYFEGTQIQLGDRQCFMDPDGTVPEIGDQVIVGSTTYSIFNVLETSPAGTVLLYELWLRK